MPPPSRNNPKKKKNRQRRPKKPKPVPNFSVEELTEAAGVASGNQELDTAVALFSAALDAQSKLLEAATAAEPSVRKDLIEQHVGLLEKRAETKASAGDPDGAREDYQKALDLHKSTESLLAVATTTKEKESLSTSSSLPLSWHERSASLYLYIGQSSAGRDALAAYEQALAILEATLSQRSTELAEAAIVEMTQQLSSICCNAAEVFLTDLCDEPDAEQQCENWVQKALSHQIPSTSSAQEEKQPTIDALQLLANLRISQCRPAEAIPAILQAYKQIEIPCRSLARLVDLLPNQEDGDDDNDKDESKEQAKELSHYDLVQSLPGFEFRCQMVKIMLEAASVAETADMVARTQCRDAAISVLGSLMAENDQVIEVWSLLGDAFASIGSNEEAASYWQGAAEMLSQLKKSIEEDMQDMGDEDEDEAMADQREDEMQQQLDDIICQLEDLQRKLAEVPTGDEDGVVPMQE